MQNKKGVEALYEIIDTMNYELISNPFVNKVTICLLYTSDAADE